MEIRAILWEEVMNITGDSWILKGYLLCRSTIILLPAITVNSQHHCFPPQSVKKPIIKHTGL